MTKDELSKLIREALLEASLAWRTVPNPVTNKFDSDKIGKVHDDLLRELEPLLMRYEKYKEPEKFSYKGVF
jgi:hypothetical protein